MSGDNVGGKGGFGNYFRRQIFIVTEFQLSAPGAPRYPGGAEAVAPVVDFDTGGGIHRIPVFGVGDDFFIQITFESRPADDDQTILLFFTERLIHVAVGTGNFGGA